jgi:4-hydroxy-tetrahydrodipicolinate reductase
MKNQKKVPKIAVIGYGAMGRQIESVCLANGLAITEIFDIDSKIDIRKSYAFDVAIDFSFPAAVLDNAKAVSKLGKNLVIGTTGWEKDFGRIKTLTLKSNIGLVYGSNFSVGMQMFFRIADFAAKIKSHQNEFDIFVHEIHHKRKKDSPSGTALSLADIILNKVPDKKKILAEKSNTAINQNELHVSSTRGGDVPGTHTIYIDSPADTIELTHRARNRNGFAEGAVMAAKWIHGKAGFFDFREVVASIWDL